MSKLIHARASWRTQNTGCANRTSAQRVKVGDGRWKWKELAGLRAEDEIMWQCIIYEVRRNRCIELLRQLLLLRLGRVHRSTRSIQASQANIGHKLHARYTVYRLGIKINKNIKNNKSTITNQYSLS